MKTKKEIKLTGQQSLREYYFVHKNINYPTIMSLGAVFETVPAGLYVKIKMLTLENIMKHHGYLIYRNEYIQIKKIGT